MGQNNAAAERSAHVTRGGRSIPGESFLVEVRPGVFQIKAVAEAQREIAALKESLHDARNGVVAASECAGRMMEERDEAFIQIAHLRHALEKIAHSADYDTIICPDGDRHQQAIEVALEALGGSNA